MIIWSCPPRLTEMLFIFYVFLMLFQRFKVCVCACFCVFVSACKWLCSDRLSWCLCVGCDYYVLVCHLSLRGPDRKWVKSLLQRGWCLEEMTMRRRGMTEPDRVCTCACLWSTVWSLTVHAGKMETFQSPPQKYNIMSCNAEACHE